MFTPFAFIQPFAPGILIPGVPDFMYVAGAFTTYKQPLYSNIVRTNLSGSVDTSFNMGTGFNSTVYAMVTQSDGKLIVGGGFSVYSGSNQSYIARLNTDGTRDTTFNIGAGFNSSVFDVKIQSDGKIVAVGNFTSYSGSAVNRITRINTDGTRDTTFNVGTGFTQTPYCVAIQSDGKVLVGGNAIIAYSGSLTGTGSLRINTNGTLDSTFNTGVGFSSTSVVYSIDIQNDGKILMGTSATAYSGSTVTRLVRLNTNGNVDSSFNPGIINNSVLSVKIQPDQKILIVGVFSSVSGSTSPSISRINSNGQRDATFNIGTGLGGSIVGQTVNCISLDSTGNVYVGNGFTSYSGSVVNRYVKITTNGTRDLSFNTGSIGFNGQSSDGFNSTVWSTLVSGSNVYIGGSFTTYSAPPYTRIIKLNNTGSIDTVFNMGAGFNNVVYTMATQSDGKIIAGGDFTAYSGSNINRLCRLNISGTLDTTFNIGTGINGTINQVSVLPDGKILATGAFTTYSGSSSSGIVRINTNGTRDTTFNVGSGFTGTPYSFHVQSDGKIVAVGTFSVYSGSGAGVVTRIVRINTDGTRDLTFNTGTGLSNNTYTITGQADGKLIAAGDFTSYSGSTVNRLVRINTDGTRDLTFQPGTTTNGGMYNLKLLADETILVGGIFTSYSSSTVSRLIRVNSNGSRNTSFVPGQGANLGPSSWGAFGNNSISLDKNGAVYIGSSFTSYSGSATGYIAKLNVNGVRDTSFDAGSLGFNNTGNGFDTAVYSVINLI